MRISICFCLSLCMSAHALEISDPPPAYLSQELAPDWQLLPLADVLTEIEEIISCPLNRSAAIQSSAPERVLLIERDDRNLANILTLLEQTHDLHFAAETLTLHVQRGTELRKSRRRSYSINLRAYGYGFTAPDYPAPALGYWAARGSCGFDLFGGSYTASNDHAHSLSADDLQELMCLSLGGRLEEDGAAIHMNDIGNAMVQLTPEEHATIIAMLEDALQETIQRSAWRISFGILPAALPAQTGIINKDQASHLRQKLQEREDHLLTALPGQRAHIGRVHEFVECRELHIGGAGMPDPVVENILCGRVCDLAIWPGQEHMRLSGRVAWVEPRTLHSAEYTGLSQTYQEAATVTLSGTITSEEAEDEDEEPQEEEVSIDGELEPSVRKPASGPSQFRLQHRSLWNWQQPIDCFVPRQGVLALQAPHPQGSAIIIIEEVQP